MWEKFIEVLTATPIWELALIFCSRIIEVSMGTLRIILINKGYRRQGVVLAFFEVLLWVFVASRVITGINEQPVKAIVYSLGFASGVYLGSKLENRLAFGKILIQSITTPELGAVITEYLRNQGLGVTAIKAQGKTAEKVVLMVYANRRGQENIIKQIISIDEHAMIVTNDVSTLHGGYIHSSYHRFFK